MMTGELRMTNNTIYLQAYQPPVFAIASVSLLFDLYDDHALVTSQLHAVRQHPGELVLLGENIELLSVHLNGQQLMADQYTLTNRSLTLPVADELLAVDITVVTRLRPQDNTELSGLYRSKQLFCTQCEPEGFRRITYFPDRPDVLAIYTTRIQADKARFPVLLSNGNLVDAGDLPNGRHWVIWQDPFKKPCYLFALVAGDLACVEDYFTTCSGRQITLRIFVEWGNEDKCAHAMHALKNAMRWDEEQFGREYDLDVFMIVAVSDFNMGAMENKGLNIFNDQYILARPDTATDEDYANIEAVVAHEYFHNWTGNRVTCRDWFQLSLKEGLTVYRDQEFSADLNSRDVCRIQGVNILRRGQFPEDDGRMAHPVRPNAYQEINNFYTSTIYNKGAEVIRMLATLVGKVGFRRGMDLYFTRHDGQAVTVEDFVRAMQDANAIDLTQFMRWYTQAGRPHVCLEALEYVNGQLTLTFTQTCAVTPDGELKQPFVIPIRIALFSAQGQSIPIDDSLLVLTQAKQSFVLKHITQAPVVSLLQDFSAPIQLTRKLTNAQWLQLFAFETNGYAKWDAGLRVAQAVITHCYAQTDATAWAVDSPLLAAYQQTLVDERLDGALRAELLTPPAFELIAVNLPHVDVARLEQVRDFFRLTVSQHLSADAQALYQTVAGVDYNGRRLRNLCLWLMVHAKQPEALAVCQQQFVTATNMTDQLASFTLLAHCQDEALRLWSIEQFYQQWQHDDLVLDKWLMIQANSPQPGALARVQTLLHHPAFNLKNPNKVRALLGGFCQNLRHFHAIDGSGYAFLTEQVLLMDTINPQVAARLTSPFTRWQRVDPPRQALILGQLERLASGASSPDLRELVTKSLVRT
jgi:aminopeptidase N